MYWIQFLVNHTSNKGKLVAGFDSIKTCFDNFSDSLFGQKNNLQGKYSKNYFVYTFSFINNPHISRIIWLASPLFLNALFFKWRLTVVTKCFWKLWNADFFLFLFFFIFPIELPDAYAEILSEDWLF